MYLQRLQVREEEQEALPHHGDALDQDLVHHEPQNEYLIREISLVGARLKRAQTELS
jgi:hypothetical protein